MSQDVINRTCKSLTLPLYALIHDSAIHALQASRVSRQVALAVLREIPKLPLSRKEQDELKNANGAIELEDSFGSGNFFVMDAGSQEAFVCSDKKHANYLDQLLESRSDQDFLPDDRERDDGRPAQFCQVQAPPQQSQGQANQAANEELLTKLQLLEMVMQGNQKNRRRNIRIGQKNQQNERNLLQQIALLEILRGADTNELLNKLQMLQLAEVLSEPGKGQPARQGGQQPQQQNQNQNQNQNQQPDGLAPQQQGQQQGQNLLETLSELQLIKALQQS